MSYRAVEMQSPGLAGLRTVERPIPVPAPGQALLRMRASCLNYHDFVTVSGLIPGLPYPLVPLSDGCGEVVSLGEGVTRVAEGDRVAPNFFPGWTSGRPSAASKALVLGERADGCLQQYLLVDAQCLAKAPEHLTDLEVATLPCAGLTAWNALIQPRLQAGERVLIQGTGGVSIFALQFAKALGAEVILISSSDEKLARARERGADHVVNYREHPEWQRVVLELTGGEGVDLVVDVGGPETLARSIEAAALCARISLVGVLSGYQSTLDIPAIFWKHLVLHGIAVGSRDEFDAMNVTIEAHELRPVISDVFAMDEVAKALELMERGGHFGKIALQID